jgi:phenylalanyl-tRNA synthetase alpha chain
MDHLLQQIEGYRQEVAEFNPANADELEQFRIRFLGTKGIVKAVMGEMKQVPNENKKAFGQLLNEFKQFVETRYELMKEAAAGTEESEEQVDWSLPGSPVAVGTRHPLSIVRNRIVSIFQQLGFALAEGPIPTGCCAPIPAACRPG